MSRNPTTEIRINERGDEAHESWLLVRANTVSQTPGAHLFDSEIPHSRYIVVTVTRCTRKRQLNHDYHYNGKVLLEMSMSQAQWGAFVSSFGQGTGVPATLMFLTGVGEVPQAPAESRFDVSHREVRESGERALAHVTEHYQRVMEAFENGRKPALRESLRGLGIALGNAPANMEFAASSLTEHVENVVTKARSDIEGMALAAMEQGALTGPDLFQLEGGEYEEEDEG